MHIVHTDTNGWACALVCELGNCAHVRRFWAALGRLGIRSRREHCWQDTGLRCWGFMVDGQLIGVRESYGELIIEGPAAILEPLAEEVGPDPEGSHLPRHTFVYNGQEKVKNETFDSTEFAKLNCAIKVSGQCNIDGTYKRTGGTLEVWIDGQSKLEVSGEAYKVVIKWENGQSTVDLRGMRIGAGGIEIKGLNGQSKLYIGECGGKIEIESIDGQCWVHYKRRTKVVGREKVKGGSELKEE